MKLIIDQLIVTYDIVASGLLRKSFCHIPRATFIFKFSAMCVCMAVCVRVCVCVIAHIRQCRFCELNIISLEIKRSQWKAKQKKKQKKNKNMVCRNLF